jgi:hypothetical protein
LQGDKPGVCRTECKWQWSVREVESQGRESDDLNPDKNLGMLGKIMDTRVTEAQAKEYALFEIYQYESQHPKP